MSIKNIATKLINFAGPTGLKAQQAAPEIFLGLGILGIAVSTVLACRATLKVEGIIDDHKNNVEKIKRTADELPESYTGRDKQQDLAVTYLKTGGEFLKVYGPAIGIFALSIGAIVKGHNIMKGRNLALIAAYKGIQEAFSAYRKRVVEEHGEKADYMYKNGLRAVEITTPGYVDENGNKVEENTSTVIMADEDGLSGYAKLFNKKNSTQFSDDKTYNMYFLIATQNHFNDLLKARKHVFLNEVYDALGLDRTQAGAIVGWKYGGDGDNVIDFGVFNPDTNEYEPLVMNEDGSVILDFNVDKVIYNTFTPVKM